MLLLSMNASKAFHSCGVVTETGPDCDRRWKQGILGSKFRMAGRSWIIIRFSWIGLIFVPFERLNVFLEPRCCQRSEVHCAITQHYRTTREESFTLSCHVLLNSVTEMLGRDHSCSKRLARSEIGVSKNETFLFICKTRYP